jgi:hypothetical protein
MVKMVSEAKMENVKAALAWNVAALLDKQERVSSIASFMNVDQDEAKRLIQRGRRIARERVGAG